MIELIFTKKGIGGALIDREQRPRSGRVFGAVGVFNKYIMWPTSWPYKIRLYASDSAWQEIPIDKRLMIHFIWWKENGKITFEIIS